MPQLMNFDIAGAVRKGQAFGTKMRQMREAEERQRNIADTAELAYHADPARRQELVGHAVGIDPDAGFALGEKLGSSEERRNKTMVNMAKMLTSAPKQARPALYQRMVPTLAKFGLSELPQAYTPETAPIIDQAAQSLVGALSGPQGGVPAGLQEFNAYVEAATAGMPPEQAEEIRKQASMQKLYLAPKPVSEMYDFDVIETTEGPRLAVTGRKGYAGIQGFSPVPGTQTQTAPTGPVGGAGAPVPEGGGDAFVEETMALANQLIASGVPPEQVDTFVRSRLQPAGAAPAAPSVAPVGGARPLSSAEEAAAIERAKLTAQMGLKPELEAATERATTEAKAEAERNAEVAERQIKGMDVLGLLDAAEVLIPASTGSGVGELADAAASFFGVTLDGASAIRSLQAIAGQIVSKMPRMEGPQGVYDVQLYEQMAGNLADPGVPREQRMAALETIRSLNRKYAGQAQSRQQLQASPQQSEQPTQAPQTGSANDPLGIL